MFDTATSLDISFIHLLFYSHTNYDKFPKISLIGTFRNAGYFTDTDYCCYLTNSIEAL